ncbi:MAG: GntR family transcriptional regulator [Caulobacteraceae bacterium]
MTDAPLVTRLREMILSGELAPGERLAEARLAERLGVSRTPVRNALPALLADGLLEPIGRRGFAVRAFSDTESVEALRLRGVLEGHAARRLAEDGPSQAVLDALQRCLEEGDALFAKRCLTIEDEQLYGAMNARFHALVVESGGTPLLRGLLDRINRVPFVAPAVIVFDEIGLPKAYELLFRAHGTHHAIVDALKARDGARAEALFREHAHEQRLSMFTRRQAQRARGA